MDKRLYNEGLADLAEAIVHRNSRVAGRHLSEAPPDSRQRLAHGGTAGHEQEGCGGMTDRCVRDIAFGNEIVRVAYDGEDPPFYSVNIGDGGADCHYGLVSSDHEEFSRLLQALQATHAFVCASRRLAPACPPPAAGL